MKMSGELLLFAIILLLFICSCRSTDTAAEHYREQTVLSDSTTKASQESVSFSTERYDSILFLLLQKNLSMHAQRDEHTESIEERIHTRIDTSGNIIREESRTIERARSTESEEALLSLISEQRLQMERQIHVYDSLMRNYMDSVKTGHFEKEQSSERKKRESMSVFALSAMAIFALTLLIGLIMVRKDVFPSVCNGIRNLFRSFFR